MGLDAYINLRVRKNENVICPCCGYVIQKTKENIFNDREDEICYFRKEWWLHDFISTNISVYDDDMYDKDLELSIDDLKLIRKEIVNHYTSDMTWNEKIKWILDCDWILKLDHLIMILSEDDTKCLYAVYNANW